MCDIDFISTSRDFLNFGLPSCANVLIFFFIIFILPLVNNVRSVDTTMKVWDVRNKTCIQTYTGHEKEVTCVRFSPDGRWVASSSKDGQLLIWDLIAGDDLNHMLINCLCDLSLLSTHFPLLFSCLLVL